MPYPLDEQKEDLWCWAAVCESVLKYFSPGTHVMTQCEIADGLLGRDDCCAEPSPCNEVARLQDALAAIDRLKATIPDRLSFPEIREQIDSGFPVCVRIGWKGGTSGHFVVICGYRESASGKKYVTIADPLFPNSILPYDAFRSSYQNTQTASGGGEWTATFLVQA